MRSISNAKADVLDLAEKNLNTQNAILVIEVFFEDAITAAAIAADDDVELAARIFALLGNEELSFEDKEFLAC
ncbi:hypothetical protein QR98_0098970 [Sarcoptes scabiei]|uniref:Uncharacterized protein n=1 Tax=Sarcoptes scabiei TaxID=52283 RepID=A0A132AK14_SARSC|nr:hypothetical protein QR98_0098970 [Sarcoptes scabiei]